MICFKVFENPDRVAVTFNDIPFCNLQFDGTIIKKYYSLEEYDETSISFIRFIAFIKAYVQTLGKEVDEKLIIYS